MINTEAYIISIVSFFIFGMLAGSKLEEWSNNRYKKKVEIWNTKAGGWINADNPPKLKQNLPSSEFVQFFTKEEGVIIGKFCKVGNNEWWSCAFGIEKDFSGKVTHWRPLPQEPTA